MANAAASLHPVLRYEDAPAAIEWLQKALGFETLFRHDEAGKVEVAFMGFGGDVLGTGTVRPGWREAIGAYVPDVDEHYRRAIAAGTKLTDELADTDFGARMYGAVDIEGHRWAFGSFRPEEKARSIIFPALGYRDAAMAMRFLTDAFGFEKREAYTEHGFIVHAEMSFGDSGIMLGTKKQEPDADNPWATAMRGLYVYVEDVDAHYERASADGADIVRPLNDTDYGAREYSLRDPEGNLWSFGTYMPGWMKGAS